MRAWPKGQLRRAREPRHRGLGARDGEPAAATIEPERAPEIDRIQRLAAEPPRLVLARGVVPRLVCSALPWLLRLPLARSRAGGYGALFLNGVTEVRLRV